MWSYLLITLQVFLKVFFPEDFLLRLVETSWNSQKGIAYKCYISMLAKFAKKDQIVWKVGGSYL